MLDRNDRQYFTGQDVQSVLSSLQSTLHASGIQLMPTGPSSWSGRGTLAVWSMVPKIQVSVMPVQGGFFLDLRISPDFEGNGIVLFVVSWFFFFPVAIVLAVLAYQDWQNRQTALFNALWAPLASRMAPPPGPQWPLAPGGAPPG
jgi:hypothetical protein